MIEKSKQKIKDEINKLPKEWQDIIRNSNWEKISEEIGGKHFFTENEINDFQLETALILLGIEDEDSYALNIESNIVTSKKKAEEIAREINQRIFTPISERIEGKNPLKNNPEKPIISSAQIDEEIPLPPYAKIITNDQLPINNEVEDSSKEEEKQQVPVEQSKNILEEKMKSPSISNHTVSDYSTKSPDPYREEIM